MRIDDALCERDVICQRPRRVLHDADRIPIFLQTLIDLLSAGTVNKPAMDKNDRDRSHRSTTHTDLDIRNHELGIRSAMSAISWPLDTLRATRLHIVGRRRMQFVLIERAIN